MAKNTMNLQDSFLNQVRKDNTEIEMVLIGGNRILGYVRGFDKFTVIITAKGGQHLVYKHAIAQSINKLSDRENPGGGGFRQEGPRQPGKPGGAKSRRAVDGGKFNSMDLSKLNMDDQKTKPEKVTASVLTDSEKQDSI